MLKKYGERVLCVVSTTSCFAPRAYDSVVDLAKLCAEFKVAHMVNSAYGLQCTRISADLVEASRVGRLDIIVSSTDKNFMVPVGGSILYSPDKAKDGIISKVNKIYPGRASSSPIIDLFVTLLQMGETNFKQLLKERKDNFKFLSDELSKLAEKVGERVLTTQQNNKISVAFSLTALNDKVFKPNNINATFFGSYLFHRRVSGVRVCNESFGKE